MIEKLPPLFEKLSTYLAGIVFIAGILFTFLGFFDVKDLKSVDLRAGAAWAPIGAGGLLVAVGLLLHVFRAPRPERDPYSQQSGGLVYVLRHLDARGDYRLP